MSSGNGPTGDGTEMDEFRSTVSNNEPSDELPPPRVRSRSDLQNSIVRPRNALKRYIWYYAIALVVSLVILIIVYLLPQRWPNVSSEPSDSSSQSSPLTRRNWNRLETKEGESFCASEECMRAALAALDKMDTSVLPCKDFYHYACGRYIKDTEIPDEKNSTHTFSVIGDLMQKQLLSLVSEKVHTNELSAFKLVKRFYKLCMNKTRIEEQGIRPLLDILDTLGDWPVLKGDDWNTDYSWSWTKSMKDLRMLGYSTDYLFDFSVDVDLKIPNHRVIYIDQASLNVNRRNLIEDQDNPIVSAYYNSMVDIAVFLGAEEARAKQELQNSLNFEIALARISLANENRHNATALYNPISVEKFQNKYPYTNWVDYFNAMLKDTGIVIDKNNTIIVRNPRFMEQLGPLLQNTTERTMANYVMWRVVSFSSSFLTETLQGQQPQCSAALSRKQEQELRQKECLEITTERLPIPVGALYIRKYFNYVAKSSAENIVNEVKNAFVDILNKSKWMDENTKQSALEKMDSMNYHIGYLDDLMNDYIIAEYYKGLVFKPDEIYLSTVLYVDRIATTKKFKKLHQPVGKTDWTTHLKPTDFNARYSLMENSVWFTAGILQGQLFSYLRPKYLNYGSFGFTVGREILHGFYDKGRWFDRNGSSEDWWQLATQVAHRERANCIVEQYGNYKDQKTNVFLNGFNTKIENIADNGGIKIAYYAYKKWAEKNGPESVLPLLDLTPEQTFWLSAAQSLCSVYRPVALEERIVYGTSSPSQFRVVGSMSNMVEFAKDFNCPVGFPMSPLERCNVW